MTHSLPDLCDRYPDEVSVLEPVFRDFGGKHRFSGEIVTIKCFEDNSLVAEMVREPGLMAAAAVEHGWQGLVVHGCVRDVEILATLDLGVKALAACPVRTDKRGEGQRDVPLRFAGALMEPGHYLYADANGVIVAKRDLGDLGSE